VGVDLTWRCGLEVGDGELNFATKVLTISGCQVGEWRNGSGKWKVGPRNI